MKTDYEFIRKLLGGVPLTDVEFCEMVEMAKNCYMTRGNCPDDCPLREYKQEDEYVPCPEVFAKFIHKYTFRFGGNPNTKMRLNELADNVTKICNEIKKKTSRETPTRVVRKFSNGKWLYSCYNCGKPLFIQPSTQYCECCGQKLSFEVVENEI